MLSRERSPPCPSEKGENPLKIGLLLQVKETIESRDLLATLMSSMKWQRVQESWVWITLCS